MPFASTTPTSFYEQGQDKAMRVKKLNLSLLYRPFKT